MKYKIQRQREDGSWATHGCYTYLASAAQSAERLCKGRGGPTRVVELASGKTVRYLFES